MKTFGPIVVHLNQTFLFSVVLLGITNNLFSSQHSEKVINRMENNAFWYFEDVDVSGIFCPKKLSSGQQQLVHRTFKKGSYIFVPEEDANRIYFIMEGGVKIGTHNDQGKEIIKIILGSGEIFGELAIIEDAKRRDFAITTKDTTLCVIHKSELNGLLRNHSALGIFLMQLLGNRMIQIEKRLENLVFKDSRTRIIEFLHELGSKKGQRVGYEMLVRNFMTHKEIANFTATSRQTVTTILNELRNKNLLTFNRSRLLIRDMDGLKSEIRQ